MTRKAVIVATDDTEILSAKANERATATTELASSNSIAPWQKWLDEQSKGKPVGW